MIQYIRADLAAAAGCLPCGLAMGLPAAMAVIWLRDRRRQKARKPSAPRAPVMAFCVYMAVMLVITFWSRESGSRAGVMDLEPFSTWGINSRNNAFVIENVLLFIPYGFLFCWNLPRKGRVFRCVLSGAALSLGIEIMQLATGRGYFQLDDIMTNALGAFIGAVVFAAPCFLACMRRNLSRKNRNTPGAQG